MTVMGNKLSYKDHALFTYVPRPSLVPLFIEYVCVEEGDICPIYSLPLAPYTWRNPPPPPSLLL